ncbi:glycerophosphodiester phosphodiesterase [Candidatus Bipolaricaulota bacterium]|nr:glycerophosphodiester phosphodiesterase [Candidatus Bipolaricaulota bacterium]
MLAARGEQALPGGSMSKPLVLAHRGARSVAPENTLAAARRAAELGADGWELDVQLTADGELIVMHDGTLTRTTDAASVFPGRAPWRVADFTLDEIRTLDAGSWFMREDPFGTIAGGEVTRDEAQAYRGERVPTLREALLLSADLGLVVNIELKGTPLAPLSPQGREMVEKVVALVRELGLVEGVIVSSFDHERIRYLKAIAPDIPAALLVLVLPSDPVGYVKGYGADALNPQATAYDGGSARQLRAAGYGVYLWTVNAPDELARFAADPCVSGIITDWPQRLRTILGPTGYHPGGPR